MGHLTTITFRNDFVNNEDFDENVLQAIKDACNNEKTAMQNHLSMIVQNVTHSSDDVLYVQSVNTVICSDTSLDNETIDSIVGILKLHIAKLEYAKTASTVKNTGHQSITSEDDVEHRQRKLFETLSNDYLRAVVQNYIESYEHATQMYDEVVNETLNPIYHAEKYAVLKFLSDTAVYYSKQAMP